MNIVNETYIQERVTVSLANAMPLASPLSNAQRVLLLLQFVYVGLSKVLTTLRLRPAHRRPHDP